MCHPGTLATFSDGQAYLLNRYPNRDLVAMEGQLVRHIRYGISNSNRIAMGEVQHIGSSLEMHC